MLLRLLRRALLKGRKLGRRWCLLGRIRGEAWLQGAEVELNLHPSVELGQGLRIEILPGSRTRLQIGRNSKLGDGVRLRLRGGEISLGESVDVRATAVLNVGGGSLRLDGFNNLAWGVVIHCAESVHLKRFAHVAEYSTLVDSSHFYSAPEEWSYHNVRTRPIVLEEDVWVCPKSTIASGVTIGDHTIVAANSCVTKSMPRASLVSGVPAQVVRAIELPWEGAKADDRG